MVSRLRFSNLYSVLSSIFGFVEPITPIPDLYDLFPFMPKAVPYAVQHYFQNVTSVDRIECLGKSTIIKMEYCKRRSDKKPEFIIITITHPDVKRTATLMAERTLFEPTSPPGIISSPGTHVVWDTVTVAGLGYSREKMLQMKEDPYDVLETLGFPESSPSVVDLALVLELTRQFRLDYDLYDTQCYWFAMVVWRVMQKAFRGIRTSDEKAIKNVGRFGFFHLENLDGVEKIVSDVPVARRHINSQEAHDSQIRESARREADIEWQAVMDRQTAQIKQLELEHAEKVKQLELEWAAQDEQLEFVRARRQALEAKLEAMQAAH